MNEFFIELQGEQRSDCTVSVFSDDLPLFNVVGTSDDDALNLALKILPDYLKANVPEFVDLRRVKSANQVMTKSVDEQLLPAHIIARMSDGNGCNGSSTSSSD